MRHGGKNVKRLHGNGGENPERYGFTLIELLSAMAILMVIVLTMTTIFIESDRAWRLGASKAEVNIEGRAALQSISHDLQYMVADDLFRFVIHNNNTVVSYGFTNNLLAGVSLQHDSSISDRTAREVFYWVQDNGDGTYDLIRAYYSGAISGPNYLNHCYHSTNWYQNPPPSVARGVIARNVSGLRFYAPGSNGPWTYDSAANANSNSLPDYVDVFLEILSHDDVKQVQERIRMGTNPNGFVGTNAIRFSTRIYFHNRRGYANR
jgi:prepilin-type N-terminal cleavage/methylation domain-containing protein